MTGWPGHSIRGRWIDEAQDFAEATALRLDRQFMWVASQSKEIHADRERAVRRPMSGLSREAVDLHVVDRARAVGSEPPRGPFRARVARSPIEMIAEAMNVSVREDQRALDLWLKERVALTHLRGEIATIRVVARHSWAWSYLGVNQWCERRRSS